MGVQRNFLFSAVLTVSNYIFPFLVYPYVLRVLGVNNIGICNFVDSIVNYAMLVSLLGISVTGTREIAKAKGDPRRLGATFTALFVITAASTLVSTVALVTVTYTVDALQPYRPLLLIGLIKLWGNFLLIDWFYKGIEDFRYITIRTILVKMAYVAAVFILIHQSGDYVTYFLLLCLMVAVNAALNCVQACRMLRFSWDPTLIRRSARPILVLGVYLALNTMYTTFNVMYLGFACGEVQVGYYTTSTKIFQIILAIYTAYSTVVMPRASALLEAGRTDDFRRLIGKSLDGLMLFAIPVAIYMLVFSNGIVNIIAGDQYGGAVWPMRIVMPLLFIIGYEQILIVQILTPMSRDRAILTNSVIGAIVGVALNIVLVGRLASVGSAIVWVAAEVAVLVSAQRFVRICTGIGFPWRRTLLTVLAYLPFMAGGAAMVWAMHDRPVSAAVAGGVLFVIYFLAVQRWVLRNELYHSLAGRLAQALRLEGGEA